MKLNNTDSQDPMYDEYSPTKVPATDMSSFTTAVSLPKRRGVHVLDMTESAKIGAEIFVHFKLRLHPWTTIKVSTKQFTFLEVEITNLIYCKISTNTAF